MQKADALDGLPRAMAYSHTDRLGRFALRQFMHAPVDPYAIPGVATTEVSRLARAHGRDFDYQTGLNSTLQKISEGSILRVSLSALELAIQDGDKEQLAVRLPKCLCQGELIVPCAFVGVVCCWWDMCWGDCGCHQLPSSVKCGAERQSL